jgi:hypothetical protein
MNKLLTVFLVFFAFSQVLAQKVKTSWVKNSTSTTDVYYSEVGTDGLGNIYIGGWFSGTTDFGSVSLTSNGAKDYFLMKQNPAGQLIWVKKIGGTSNEELLYELKVDNAGNAYMTGAFSGTITVVTSPLTSYGGTDGFLIKIDSSGNHVWSKALGSSSDDQATSVRLDYQGNVIVSGFFRTTGNFGGINLTSNGSADVFVAKFSSAGNTIWANKYGSTAYDQNYALTTDNAGYIYISGNVGATITFGNSTASGSYFAKLSSAGTPLWAKSISGIYTSYQMQNDAKGDIILLGWFTNSINLMGKISLSSYATNDQDFFVARIDSSGNPSWAYAANSPGAQYGLSLSLDSEGSIYMSGQTSDSLNYRGFRKRSIGGVDAFVLKTDSAGGFIESKVFGSALIDESHGVAASTGGAFYMVGTYRQNQYFDNVFVSGGAYGSGYLAKLELNLMSQPSVPASGIQTFNVGKDSMNVKFTKGNGSGRLVLARKGSAVNISPVDQNTYTANNIFAQGAQIANGIFVVYNGVDSSFLLKGLEPNSLYFLSVVEYNGLGDSINYLTTNSPSLNQFTKPDAALFGSLTFCNGDSTKLTATTGNNLTFQWYKDSILIQGATAQTVYAKSNGTYKVQVTNVAGTSISNALQVVVKPLPPASITLTGNDTICATDSVLLAVPYYSTNTYQWKLNNVSINTGVNNSLWVKSSGSYSVKVTDNVSTCLANSTAQNIVVNQPPVLNFSMSNNDTICSGDTLLISASPSNGINSFQWWLNNAIINGANSAQLAVTATGSYTLSTLYANTCARTYEPISAVVIPLPNASVTQAGNATFCFGDSVVFQANSGNGYTYNWFNASTSLNVFGARLAVVNSGNYSVRVTDKFNCSKMSSVFNVIAHQLPSALITLPTASSLGFCLGDSLFLYAKTAPGLQYQWLNNNLPIVQSVDSFLTVKNAGNYAVRVVDNNTCKSTSPIKQVNVNTPPTKPLVSNNGNTLTTVSGFLYQWYFNGSLIPNATAQFLTASQNGFYSVKITDINGCFSISDPFNFSTTGIENHTGIDNLQLYPNPNNGNFTIQFFESDAHLLSMQLVDVLGRVVYAQNRRMEAGLNMFTVNVNTVPGGIYFLHLDVNDKSTIVKVRIN